MYKTSLITTTSKYKNLIEPWKF